MFLFNEAEAAVLRERAKRRPFIFGLLDRRAGYLAKHDLYVPEISAANWGMYYHCPYDAAQLAFDFEQPHAHRCPVCGRIQSGEPYDSAWESVIHRDNAETALRYAYLYVLTQKPIHAEAAMDILLTYAQHYPDYQIHGDIPYNGPGRAFAQTLDEAVFLRQLGYAFDMAGDSLPSARRAEVLERLFRPGAEFLLAHRTPQVHNHEVLINSAAGILGILLKDETVIRQALYAPYGLLDQREKGTMEDDFWFEGTVSYHEYALEAFFTYEIFARHTAYSNLAGPRYLRMLKKARVFLLEDDTVPALNDSRCLRQRFTADLALEFGYSYYRDPEVLDLLLTGCRQRGRDNREAFFYGADILPEQERLPRTNYHSGTGSGLTIIRGTEARYLLIKHSPFGGEHDHYDRLGISFSAFGDQLCSDLGTVPYGVKWHYDYYKNTGSHNTVMVDETNQPPQHCQVYTYKTQGDRVFLDCGVSWKEPYQMPDSFVLRQWDDAAYQGTSMRRQILWLGGAFIDVVCVTHPEPRITDWLLHVDGVRTCAPQGALVKTFSVKKPLCFLSDVEQLCGVGTARFCWDSPHGAMQVFSWAEEAECYIAKGPNNPPDIELDYLIRRGRGKDCVFVHVFEAYRDRPKITAVSVSREQYGVLVSVGGKLHRFSF